MKKEMYKMGDKVSIVPNDEHLPHVKNNYDKVLTIKKIIRISENQLIYKVSNIKDYANESDLVAIIPRSDEQLDRFNEVYKDYPFQLSNKEIDAKAIIRSNN